MKLKLKIMGVLASVMLMVNSASAECIVNDITLDSTVSGSWSTGCTSTNRTGSYAQFYTFTLTETTTVQMDLESASDTYMFLLDNSGNVISSNDDNGVSFNSQIITDLPAGTYTIEATTYGSAVVDSFTLTLSTVTTTPSTCTENSITLDSTVSGSWDSGCTSTNRSGSYAQYYTFTLTETTTVQIDLESASDTYMYLLDEFGTVITIDDDGGSGTNSRINTQLAAGTYTIESTTFSSATLGDFNLSLSTVTSTNPSFNGIIEGTVDLPAEILTRVSSCTYWDCPRVYIAADIYLPDGTLYQQSVVGSVDYNDVTSRYEYQLNIGAVPSTSINVMASVGLYWYTENDTFTGETLRDRNLNLDYSFGADWSIGGTGSDADYIMEDCTYAVQRPASIDLTSTPPVLAIDLSNYIVPVVSGAKMVVNHVPVGTTLTFIARDTKQCDVSLDIADGVNGPSTMILDDLMDETEYGLTLSVRDDSGYTFYRLNDNDGDFTNGGVFLEDTVWTYVTDEDGVDQFTYIFDKTLLPTAEDITISKPNNLNLGNQGSVPMLYLLLM